jgi:two-component system sensor histidine kinase/response regulator
MEGAKAKEERIKILICDDSAADRKLIKAYLRPGKDSEFMIQEAGREQEIREALDKGGIDLVIMDILMPDKSGMEWLKEIDEKRIAPVIILTGFGSEEIAVQSIHEGAIDYIPKSSLTREKLLGAIKLAFERWRRVNAEEELKKHMKELQRANRDLEDFTSTVSHDLKAPLRSIQAFSMLLMEDYADKLDETGRDYLNRVKEAVERMVTLIEDLLTLSRVGRKFTEVEAVDLNELLEEIKSDLSARIEERGGEVVVAGKLPTLSTQRVWMKELFMNLIDNGLKFNKSEKPRVEVSCEEITAVIKFIRDISKGDWLFKVKDNGIGIEEKYQARIFNLFERLHSQSEYEGTGAGLAICKKIVEELGGIIHVESTPGEGSTFYFVIPKR